MRLSWMTWTSMREHLNNLAVLTVFALVGSLFLTAWALFARVVWWAWADLPWTCRFGG